MVRIPMLLVQTAVHVESVGSEFDPRSPKKPFRHSNVNQALHTADTAREKSIGLETAAGQAENLHVHRVSVRQLP